MPVLIINWYCDTIGYLLFWHACAYYSRIKRYTMKISITTTLNDAITVPVTQYVLDSFDDDSNVDWMLV